MDSVERWRRMIGECRRSLNSFDAEIDMAIFVGRETVTETETQIVAQNSSGRVCLYMLLFGTR